MAMQGTAGLAGLLQAVVHLQQRAALPLRYRSMNPYVESTLSDARGMPPTRLPLATGPAEGTAFAGRCLCTSARARALNLLQQLTDKVTNASAILQRHRPG